MDLREKINFKIYLPFTALTTAFCLVLAHNGDERWGIIIVYFATLLNQLALTWAVIQLLIPTALVRKDMKDKRLARRRTLKIVGAFIGKMAILLVGLSLGVHLMGPRVIIPLLNYVVQIFILVLSFKRKAEGT